MPKQKNEIICVRFLSTNISPMIGMAKHEYADIPIPTRNLVTKNNQNNYLYFQIKVYNLINNKNK